MPMRFPSARIPVALRLALFVGLSWCVVPDVRAASPVKPPLPPAGWEAKRIFDPFRNTSRCVVETEHQKIHDGYQETEVYLQLDGKSLRVVTESNLDLRQADVGLRVDDQKLLRPERLHLDQTAVFENEFETIIRQFKTGRMVTFSLRFWPSWPSKGIKTVPFSLIGFERAYQRLPAC